MFSCVYSAIVINHAFKGRYSSSWEPHLRATGRRLSYVILWHFI